MVTTLKRHSSTAAPVKPRAHVSPMTPDDRRAAGKGLRDTVLRDTHGGLAGASGSDRPSRHTSCGGRDLAADLPPSVLWPHVAISVHVLMKARRRCGGPTRSHAGHGNPCPGLW